MGIAGFIIRCMCISACILFLYTRASLVVHAALPPVFVPTNMHHDIPAVLPSLAEDTLPENVILPSGDPPQAFPGELQLELQCSAMRTASYM